MAATITDSNFESDVLKSTKPVMVDFFAEWCGPCKLSAPIIDRLAEEYKDSVYVGKLDVDTSPQAAEKYGVMSIPTVIMFKDGKEVERKIGFSGEQMYVEMIKKVTA